MPSNLKMISAASVALISTVAFLGWWIDHAALAAALPAIANMTFNTALSFLLLAAVCSMHGGVNKKTGFLSARSIPSIRKSLTFGVGLLALLSLSQDIFDLHIGIDNLLLDSHLLGLNSIHPGRMSPITALGFLLCASTLIILQHCKQHWIILGHTLIILLGMLAIIGIGMDSFMCDVPNTYTHLASISLLTAVCFLLIAVALLQIFETHYKMRTNLLLHCGIQLMYRLKYPQKFILISIIFMIPLALLMQDELRIHDERIADAKLKIIGIEHIKETEKLAKAIPEHRGMTNASIANPRLFATALRDKTKEVDRLFAENARMDQQHAKFIDIPYAWTDIEQSWQQIKSNPDNALLLWHWHTEIITLLNKHLRDLGRQTRLSYDANPAIHNLLSMQLEVMPELLEDIGQLRGQGTGFLAKKSISKEEKISLISSLSKLKLLLSEADQLLQSEHHIILPKALHSAFSDFSNNCAIFIEVTQLQMIDAAMMDTSGATTANNYFALGSQAIAQGMSLSQQNMTYIEKQLEQRINASITAQYNIKLIAMIAALLLIFLFTAFYRSVMNTITALDRASKHMQRGENKSLKMIQAQDEMGHIVASFNTIAAQLMQTSAHMSAVVDYAAEGIITIDTNGIIQTFNPAAEQIFGYPANEIIGSDIIQLMPEEFRQRHQDGLQHFVQTGNSTVIKNLNPIPVTGLKKDTTAFPMELSISSVVLDGQQMLVGMIRDTSQRESLENQLRHAQKMEAVGALVGGVAHNFNNMLAGIIGKAYIAKRKAQDRPELLSYLESIENISMQAGDMIKQLLTFAHKDFTRDQQDTPLDILIKESFKTASLSIAEDIKLELNISDSNLMVRCDANQVQQVLMNMINNARDAMENSANKQITVRLQRCLPDRDFFHRHKNSNAGSYARLSISDTGHGMDTKTADKIFDPFYTTKEVGKGTGLGLSTAFGTVTSHRGIIEVDSQVGIGTTFHIYLPLIEATGNHAEPSQEQLPASRSTNHETLLLVDDEPLLLRSNKEVLQELGYHIIKARDGKQGLEQFRKHQHDIDAVITDVVMPEMSGMDMVREIRTLNRDMPVIFITGYNQDQVKLLADELHNTMILAKPIQIPALSQHIEAILTQKDLSN